MRYIKHIKYTEGEPFPENLVEVLKIEQTGYQTFTNEDTSKTTHFYNIFGVFDNSLEPTKKKGKEQ